LYFISMNCDCSCSCPVTMNFLLGGID
jgi:hypothetical protein